VIQVKDTAHGTKLWPAINGKLCILDIIVDQNI